VLHWPLKKCGIIIVKIGLQIVGCIKKMPKLFEQKMKEGQATLHNLVLSDSNILRVWNWPPMQTLFGHVTQPFGGRRLLDEPKEHLCRRLA